MTPERRSSPPDPPQMAATVCNHTALIRSDGTAAACGNNDYGQCNLPAAGADHSMLIRSDGTAAACRYTLTRQPRRTLTPEEFQAKMREQAENCACLGQAKGKVNVRKQLENGDALSHHRTGQNINVAPASVIHHFKLPDLPFGRRSSSGSSGSPTELEQDGEEEIVSVGSSGSSGSRSDDEDNVPDVPAAPARGGEDEEPEGEDEVVGTESEAVTKSSDKSKWQLVRDHFLKQAPLRIADLVRMKMELEVMGKAIETNIDEPQLKTWLRLIHSAFANTLLDNVDKRLYIDDEAFCQGVRDLKNNMASAKKAMKVIFNNALGQEDDDDKKPKKDRPVPSVEYLVRQYHLVAGEDAAGRMQNMIEAFERILRDVQRLRRVKCE